MARPWLAACLLTLPIGVSGCKQPSPSDTESNKQQIPAATQSTTATASTVKSPNTWLGRWNGPEDTYLQLSKTGDQFTVMIKDLDGITTYPAEPDGDRIRFVRSGKVEFITAGDGQAAGMKWLLDKKHCLLIRKGEGWCRD
jgi:hypothetical protein